MRSAAPSARVLALGCALLLGAALVPFALPFAASADGGDAALVAAPVDRIQRGALVDAPALPALAPCGLAPLAAPPAPPARDASGADGPPTETPPPSRTCRRL